MTTRQLDGKVAIIACAAEVVICVASDLAGHVTGAEIVIAGGLVL